MKQSPEQVLDACLAQLNSGRDLEAVLAEHPEQADELRPMLAAAALMRLHVPPPVRKARGKQAFLEAVAARRRQVEIADGYVTELKAGVPYEQLLSRATPEMRPLVHAAWRMYTTAPPEPSPEKVAAGKQLLMAMAEHRREARRASQPGTAHDLRAVFGQLVAGLRVRPSVARRAWSGAVAVLVTLMILSAGVAGVGSAAASSLPGDAFYGVKELGRSAQVFFAFDPQRRAELNIRFSEQRLDEMQTLAAEGRPVPIELVEAWLSGQVDALQSLQQLPVEQRQLLAEMLLSSALSPEDLAARLRDAVSNPGALDDILKRSGTVLDEARASAGVADESAAQEPERQSGPGQASSELPPEKTVSRQPPAPPSAQEPEEQPAVVVPTTAENAEAAEGPDAAQVPEEQHYVQPVADDDRSHEPDHQGSGEPASASEPCPVDEPPAEETEAPAFNQPVFEEPTDTPEPGEPGGPEQVPPADPGDEPGDEPPAEPLPSPPPEPEPGT